MVARTSAYSTVPAALLAGWLCCYCSPPPPPPPPPTMLPLASVCLSTCLPCCCSNLRLRIHAAVAAAPPLAGHAAAAPCCGLLPNVCCCSLLQDCHCYLMLPDVLLLSCCCPSLIVIQALVATSACEAYSNVHISVLKFVRGYIASNSERTILYMMNDDSILRMIPKLSVFFSPPGEVTAFFTRMYTCSF